MGFDPVARRRVRRLGARARPLLLPAAVLLAAFVVVGARPPATVAAAVPEGPVVPPGRVLVAVQPAEPGVLGLAPPGSRVDVYAPDAGQVPDLTGRAPLSPATLVVQDAPVLRAPGATPGPSASDVLTGPADPGSLTLAVHDHEAAALAARSGGPLLVAVRGSPDGP